MANDPLDHFFANCPGLFFIAEADSTLARRSASLALLLGPAAGERARLADLVHPEDQDAFTDGWRKLEESAEEVAWAFRLRGAQGDDQPVVCRARRAPGRGEVHGTLHEGAEAPIPEAERDREARLLRVVRDNLPLVLWEMDPQGTWLYHDGKGLEEIGLAKGALIGKNLFDLYAGNPDIENARRALAGQKTRSLMEVHETPWENWFIPILDERGAVTSVVGISLILAESRRTEKELQEKLALIEQQQQVIRALATPIIEVWDKVLTLPMVGVVDGARAAEVMESLLSRVSRSGARFAILDLTGVATMDTETAGYLIKLIQALRLLGAEGIITGIQPSVAQTMVTLGVNLEDILTLANLRDGLRRCMRRMAEGG